MSSTTPATTGNVAVAVAGTTFWCHVCDMSVSLLPSSLLCPHCNSDFLEEFNSDENPNPNPNHDSDQNSSQLLFPSFFDPSIPTTTANSATDFPFPSVTSSDDNFLLDSPYLHRLIHHLTNSDDSSPSTTTTPSRRHSPASKSAIEAIPVVKITSAFLDIDPVVLCAVCKDQFVIDDETKQLPCTHMYHPECILPWLSQHNSCPVCRFQLPTESLNGDLRVRRRSRSRVLRLGNLLGDVDNEEALGFELRQLTRRHRLFFPTSHHQFRQSEAEPEVRFPSSQIAETVEVDVLPDSGPENPTEALSGWPNWHAHGGAVDNGNTSWVDDADVAMP